MSSENEEKIGFSPFKKYECILNNKSETFENKVQSLIEVWKSIAELDLSQFDIRYVIQIIDWAKLHALEIVLTGEWRKTKEEYRNSLLENIEKSQSNLHNINDAFSTRCQKLADVVKKPWEHPVLTQLLNAKEAKIGAEEIEFFCVETAYLVSVRLKKLCENHCEDLALNLVTNFLRCKKMSITQNFNLNATETQMWFIFDIYIALLYKFHDRNKIVHNFEELQLDEGLQLIKRFAKKRVKMLKIWKNCHRIAIFGSRFFLSKTLMKYTDELNTYLENLIKNYINLSNTETLLQDFAVSVRNITNVADAAGLCVLCEIIHKEVGGKLRHFAIEMYIRALTTDMNELERLKHVSEEEKIGLTTSRLAKTFSNLADLLDEYTKVSRECVLTAFSLEPTKGRLEKIQELAKKSGFQVLDTGQEWKCRLHPPVLPTDDIAWMCAECGDWMCKPQLSAPAMKINMALNEALQQSVLGISEALCDDLVVCLSNPRYQVLSWLLPWEDLYRLCVMYLNDPEKTKNFVTDLKFVDIDYSLFQHIKREPLDEYTGIEKGYEQYLDLDFVSDEETSSVSEDSSQDRALSLGSDGAGDPYLPPQPKSDPNTLKSLRMFRPNLKRKTAENESGVPEKLHKSGNNVSTTVPGSSNGFLSQDGLDKSNISSGSGQTINNTLPESKNVVAATLLSLGGQVALSKVKPVIQVQQKTIGDKTRNILIQTLQKRSLLNGTNANNNNCKNELIKTTNPVTSNQVLQTMGQAELSNQLMQVYQLPMNQLTQNRLLQHFSTDNNRDSLPSRKQMSTWFIPNPRNLETSTPVSCHSTNSSSKVELNMIQANLQKALQITEPEQVPKVRMYQQKVQSTTPEPMLVPLKHQEELPKVPLYQHKGQSTLQITEPMRVPLKHPEEQTEVPKILLRQHNAQSTLEPIVELPVKPKEKFNTTPTETIKVLLKDETEISRIQQESYSTITKTPPVQRKEKHKIILQDFLSSQFPSITEATEMLKIQQESHNTIPKTIVKQEEESKIIQQDPVSSQLRSIKEETEMLRIPQDSCNTVIKTLVSKEQPKQIQQEPLTTQFNTKVSTKPEEVLLNYPPEEKVLLNYLPEEEVPLNSPPEPTTIPVSITVKEQGQHKIPFSTSFKQIKEVTRTHFNTNELMEVKTGPELQVQSVQKTNQHHSLETSQPIQSRMETICRLDTQEKIIQIKKELDVCKDDVDGDTDIDHNYCRTGEDDCKLGDKQKPVDQSECDEFEECNNTNTEIREFEAAPRELLNNEIEESIIFNDFNYLDEANTNDRPIKVKHCSSDGTKDYEYSTSFKYVEHFEQTSKNEDQDSGFDEPLDFENEKNLQKTCKVTEVQDRVTEDQDSGSDETIEYEFDGNLGKAYNKVDDRCIDDQVRGLTNNKMIIPGSRSEYRVVSKNNDLEKTNHNLDYRNEDEAALFIDVSDNISKASWEYLKEDDVSEDMKPSPCKDFLTRNWTDNLKIYRNTHKTQYLNVPCFKTDYELNKNENIPDSLCVNCRRKHSIIENEYHNIKELSVVLHRLPGNIFATCGVSGCKGKRSSIFKKRCDCDRGKAPPKKNRKRNIFDLYSDKRSPRKHPRKNPLLDINRRHSIKKKSKKRHPKKIKPKSPVLNPRVILERLPSPSFQNQIRARVILERLPLENRNFARHVLQNVPGLHDFEMLRPANVDQIVNVVQVSGGRPSSNVAVSQNTQTSTQVTPHIQRIGQPRVVEQKAESTSDQIMSSTTTQPSTATTTVKPSSSQPSTLINILSQQIIRPGPNAVRARPAPLINILSQQIIRPGQNAGSTPKTTNSTIATVETLPVIKTEPISEGVTQPQVNNTIKTNSTIKTSTTPVTTQGGTILQFICKSSLPKFQQAFGKTVYQSNTETSDSTTNTVETSTATTTPVVETKKVIPTKTVPVNVQPIQGNVIYRGQMPVGQTISLIPPGSTTRQLFRITGSTHEQISLVKETVIQNKMSALLAAALQGKPKVSDQNGEVVEEYSATRITLCRPNAVQNTRIVKPVQLQIPTNVIKSPQANLSSTTLEQLREFDMVYKQIKERSSNTGPAEAQSNTQAENTEAPQRISFTYVNQVQKYTQLSPVVVVSSYNNLQPAASPALSVTSQGSTSPCVTPSSTPTLPKIASKTSKGKSLKSAALNNTAKSAPTIPKPQQKPQEDEHTTQRIFDILAEYAEQLRNSPDLNNKPAPRRRSNPPTNPSSNSKRKKGSSSSKKSGQTSNPVELDTEDLTMGSEDSSGGNIVQLSVTDDEQSQATSITPPETNSENSSNSRPVILAEGSAGGNTQSRNVIIADSSVGEALKMPNTALIVPGSYIMPVSMVKGAQQIAVVSGGSKILATVPARSGQNMLLFQSFLNQNRKGAISAVKYSTIQPISGISSQSIAGVSAQPPVILPSNSVATAVALGQPITLKKLDENDRVNNTELLLTISQPRENSIKIEDNSPDAPQPDSSTSLSSDSTDTKMEPASRSDNSSGEKMFNTFQKTNSVATSVIASCIKEDIGMKDEGNPSESININSSEIKEEGPAKSGERMQSVLVNASASNGPMLSHTNSRYRKPSESADTTNVTVKEEYVPNGDKATNSEQKIFKSNAVYYAIRTKRNNTNNKKLESELQKQAAIERELRLQKSLSEECEDLGVDEPSTSDLFPEADLLFDSNHSPTYDQTSQDIVKRAPQTEVKEAKSSMTLFSDDENSSSLRTDIFDYVEYHAVETALDYQARQLMNGNNTSNESASSCEDSTLLPNCGTMSEVTLNSPISPEIYSDNTQPALNKYKYKYSNRKKGERNKQTENWPAEVTSSEDTLEIAKNERNQSPGPTRTHISFEDELSDENFKVVRVAISKSEKEDKCQLHCEEDNKRGSRRSAKKPCSCCNGSKGAGVSNSRKRPNVSRPPTPASHKKSFFNKKR